MRVGSLFSGIGGFDLGFERAGMRTAWFCEQDEFCQRVLAKHWPGVPLYPDVTALRAADVEPVDVLCGGFPCQDISLAGKGAGIDGARSGLWAEYARLVGELRPRYVVVENVPALLGRGLGRVLGDLAALGYDAEWDCLPASAFGAPHRRDRIWLVAYPQRDSLRQQPAGLAGRQGASFARINGAAQPLADSEGEPIGSRLRADGSGGQRRGRSSDGGGASGAGDSYPDRRGCEVGTQLNGEAQPDAPDRRPRWRHAHGLRDEVPHAGGARRQGAEPEQAQGRPGPPDGGWWAVEPDVGRVADGVPARVDRLRALGNALVPQIAQWIGERLMAYEASRELERAA